MTGLLPCPFCGEVRISLNAPNPHDRYGSVNCPACLVCLPGACSDQEELVRCWNTRILNEPQPPREMWAMLYLHDWDPPKEGQEHRWEPGKNVFPQIHNVYETWQEAETLRKRMSTPEKYWVCRVRMPAHDALALSRPQCGGD